MSDNMQRIVMLQIRKGIMERFNSAEENELPALREAVPLPDDAEAKLLAEFGDSETFQMAVSQHQKAVNTISNNAIPLELMRGDEEIDEVTLRQKRPLSRQTTGPRKRQKQCETDSIGRENASFQVIQDNDSGNEESTTRDSGEEGSEAEGEGEEYDCEEYDCEEGEGEEGEIEKEPELPPMRSQRRVPRM